VSKWWQHYYSINTKYEGNIDDVNVQHKRDLKMAELDHLAIMDVDFHDVMIHNGHFKHDLYDELIDHMITDTNEKLFNRKIRNEMLMNLRKILKFFMTC